MRYIHCWSGGKDSTAGIILDHIHGLPKSEIIMSEVMFDKKREISGEIPEHMAWVRDIAVPRFEEWGYKVHILRADKDYLDCFYHVIKRSKVSGRNGKFRGYPMGGRCYVNDRIKTAPIAKFTKSISEEYVCYVGIAADEPERLERAKSKGQVSLLERYGYTEEMARRLCEEYGLLSPIYEYSKRGGCWFCPNAPYAELAYTRKCHPELWRELENLSRIPNTICQNFKYDKTFAQVNDILDLRDKKANVTEK